MISGLYKFIRPVIDRCNTIESSPADLLFLQCSDGECCHPDTAVKYIYIEHYFQKSNFGMDLYKKQLLATGCSVSDAQQHINEFNSLIASVEKNGFDANSVIETDRYFYPCDGSHLTALSLYHNLNEILVSCSNKENAQNCSYSWFCDNGFTEEEIAVIKNKADEILDKANAPLNIVLLGSCCDEADEACRLLAEFDEVVECRQYCPDEVECYNLCNDIVTAADLYGDERETKISVKNPRVAVISLKLTAPEMTTVENNELKILKGFISYRIPVIKQSQKIREVLNAKTFIKDSQLFIPKNFYQNNKFRHILNKYIK